jgi:hypothetical protein
LSDGDDAKLVIKFFLEFENLLATERLYHMSQPLGSEFHRGEFYGFSIGKNRKKEKVSSMYLESSGIGTFEYILEIFFEWCLEKVLYSEKIEF